jgi:hypothetical protein
MLFQGRTIRPSVTTSVPALTPLISLPQEIEAVMKLMGIDPGERANPIGGLREAQQQGHQAAFSEEKVLGVLSACDVTPGCLDTTTEEFQIIMGARQPWVLQGITQMGRQGQGDLLNVGRHMHQLFV